MRPAGVWAGLRLSWVQLGLWLARVLEPAGVGLLTRLRLVLRGRLAGLAVRARQAVRRLDRLAVRSVLTGSWLARLAVRRLARSGLNRSRSARLTLRRLLGLVGVLAPARVTPPVRHGVVLREVALNGPWAGLWSSPSLRSRASRCPARPVAVSQRIPERA